ncbi:hypothetical protein L211DRAFT_765777, partial [Terfezia boudieri ATCC MYA-4762]
NVPFGACTATASPEKLKKIHEGMSFHATGISILKPTNRANLFYGVRPIEGNGLGHKDLEFLIPKAKPGQILNISLIPKTLLYIDNKQDAPKIADELRLLLPLELRVRPIRPTAWNGDPRSQAEVIKTGKSRIMIATSAWGLGINDKDVERVIQWGIRRLDNLDTLVQRFGRCARDPNKQGVCILFTE